MIERIYDAYIHRTARRVRWKGGRIRNENGRQEDASRPTKRNVWPGKKKPAGIMDIFIIGWRRQSRWQSVQSGRSIVPTTTFRYGRPTELRSNWSTLPPRHKYWWKRYIYTRTTSPSAEKKPRDLLGRGLATTAISAPIIHQAEPPGQSPMAEKPMLMRFLFLDRSTYDSLESVVSGRFFKCPRQTRFDRLSL